MITRLIICSCCCFTCALAAAEDPNEGPYDRRIPLLDLRGTTLRDGLRLIAEAGAVNILATPEAGDTAIDLYLRDVPVGTALDSLARTHNLWIERDPDSRMVRFMTLEEYRAALVDRREFTTRTWTLLFPDAVSIARRIEAVFGERVFVDIPDRPLGRSFLPGNITADIDFDESGDEFGDGDDDRTGRGRRRDEESGRHGSRSVEEQRELEAEDVRRIAAAQEVELTEVLRRRRAEALITVEEGNNVVIARSLEPALLDEIGELIADLDRPTPQILLEVKILEVDLSDGLTSAVDLDFTSKRLEDGPPTAQPPNPLLPNTVQGPLNSLGVGRFGLEPNTFVYQYLNDRIRARIQLLEDEGRAHMIATPLILSQNNAPARLFIGEERRLVTNISSDQNQVSGSDVLRTTIDVTTEEREIGTELSILPRINADDTITLELVQSASTVNVDGAQLPVVTEQGLQTFAIDTVDRSTIQGTIQGFHGRTLAVGGLIRDETSDAEQKVPLLGDIPWLGWLFKRKVVRRSRTELVLLVTPYVMRNGEDGEEISEERMRSLSIHPAQWNPDHRPSGYDSGDVDAVPEGDYRDLLRPESNP